MSHFSGNLWKWQWPLVKCSWSSISHYLFTSVLLTSSLIGAITYLYTTSRRSSRNALRTLASNSKAFFKWIQTVDTSLAYGGHKLVFLDALKRVVQELNDATKVTCSASDVIDALLAHRWSIPPNTEQDLYELFNVFVTTWDEELAELKHSRESALQKIIEIEQRNKISLSSPISDKDILTSNVNITRRNVGDSISVEDKKIHDRNSLNNASLSSSIDFHPLPLNSLSFEHVKSTVTDEKLLKPPCMGLLAIQLRCCKEDCLYKKIREEKFCVLSLSLPKSPTPLLTFSRLLERYFATEYIQGASCDRCLERKQDPSCGLMRKQGFCKLPSLLIFRIERVGFSPNGYVFKRTERFLFPEFIDVREYCFFNEQNNPKQTKDSMFKYKYQLRAVSVHIGQAQSGHFITYRRGIGVQNRSTWYKTSDTEVTPVSFAQVVSSEAYMLFYDRALTTLN
uniref:ubiquitinyl hydrolase 1 n=1 Tax=Wuchereria bancrofti TaxID=6293 RepID=A0A1I8EQ05_WUCBA